MGQNHLALSFFLVYVKDFQYSLKITSHLLKGTY